MTDFDRPGERIFLASVPVLGQTLCALPASGMATTTVFFLLLTGFCFRLFRRIFPRRLIKAALVFWLAAGGQIFYDLFGLLPFWVISVFILLPPETTDPAADSAGTMRKINRRAGAFAGLVIALVMLHEILGERCGIFLFVTPAGSLLLLAVLAFFWKMQPGEKSPAPGSSGGEKRP